MANEGVSKLANSINKRIKSFRDAYSDLVIDTGTIQGDMSLLTDTYSEAIPYGQYFVSEIMTLGDTDEKLTDDVEEVEVKIPEKMRKIKPGDRVLVVWVQYDAFVISRFNAGE